MPVQHQAGLQFVGDDDMNWNEHPSSAAEAPLAAFVGKVASVDRDRQGIVVRFDVPVTDGCGERRIGSARLGATGAKGLGDLIRDVRVGSVVRGTALLGAGSYARILSIHA